MSEAEQPRNEEAPALAAGVAGELLSALEAGGELVDEGGFSIDALQARKKLREFQLADANAYVLLLVEAAVLGGANPVRVHISAGDVEISLGSIMFTPEELEQLFAAVFINLDELDELELRRRRALQKLAFACNAALRLAPKAIIVESGAQRLRLTPACETGALEPMPAQAHTRVHVDRSLLDAAGEPPEAALLRSHCALSPVPIELDGVRVSAGLMSGLRLRLADGFEPQPRRVTKIELDGHMIGRAALRYTDQLPAELTILCNGVLAERVELGDTARPAAPDFAAIVDIDLPKDLGQNKLLRGPEFERLLAAVWAVHDRIAPEDFASAGKRRPAPFVRAGMSHLVALVLWIVGIGALLYGGTMFVLLGLMAIAAGVVSAVYGGQGGSSEHE